MSGTEPTVEQIQQAFGQLATAKELFYDWMGFNTWLFKAINGLHGENYDAFMLLVTRLGERQYFFPTLGVLLVYALLSGLWRKLRRHGGVRQHFLRWFGSFLVLAAGFVVTTWTIDSLKHYLGYPRPYIALEAGEVTQVEMQSAEDGHRSLPSGHTAFITLMIVGLWPVLSPHMRVLGGVLIFMVAWSRVALGVHFPADTAAGFLLTAGIVMLLRFTIYAALRKIGINCGGA